MSGNVVPLRREPEPARVTISPGLGEEFCERLLRLFNPGQFEGGLGTYPHECKHRIRGVCTTCGRIT